MAMGDLYLSQKDKKQAGEEFKKAADLAPVRSIERLKYAAFNCANGGAEETKRIATEMTKKAPDYLPGWTLLAELAFKDKKYDEALSLLENVFSRDPENIDGRRLQSNVLAGEGRHEKSGRKFWSNSTKTIRTFPSSNMNWHAHISKITTRIKQRWPWIRRSHSIRIMTTPCCCLLQININTGHGEMVIEPLTRLLKKKPDLRSAAFLLATAYGSLDRFDDATAVLQEQAKLTPNDPQPQIALGLTYRQAKRYDEARQAFEKAAQLAPG